MLSKPSSEWVVVHKGVGERLPYNPRGVLVAHGLVPPVEMEVGDMEPQTDLLIEIREPLQLTRRWGRRRHQHRRSPAHQKLGGR